MSEFINPSQMRDELKRQVDAAGGLMAWCRKYDRSHGPVSDMLRGAREVSEEVANSCGFIMQTVFRPVRIAS